MTNKYQNPTATEWFEQLVQEPADFPVSFTYAGKRYNGFGEWGEPKRKFSAQGLKKTAELEFEKEGMAVTLIASHYPAYGVSEWTVWFENRGSENSGVLTDISSTLRFPGERPVLKGILGDHANYYEPYSYDLTVNPISFASESGRPTHVNFPYYNLEFARGGAMLAVGWAGTFDVSFKFDGEATVYTARSTPSLNTYLKPGEKIRTALFVYAPYSWRNEHYATNLWRSWFVCCNLPKADATGKALTPFSTCCFADDTGLPNSDGSISERSTTWKPTMDKMIAEGCKVDYRWFDAGWYCAPDLSSPESDWWGTVGTWELDPVKWPGKSFLESTEYARKNGMKTLVWFEPERVTDPENLAAHFGYDLAWAIRREESKAISNNIGIPECLRWTTDRICKMLRENKVEMYREDNNSNPGILWRYLDSLEGENRTGITECKFVDGHYRMWDEIIACTLSYGGAGFVDSCASGGGRNDLESLRRGVPLLRSDADRTSTALRLSMTTAFNKWVPFCGAASKEKLSELAPVGVSDVYTWRASYLPALNVHSQFVQDPDQDFGILRFGLNEWKRVAPYLLEEFYPLTPWHNQRDKSAFTAYSFFDDHKDEGVLFIFRQEDCARDKITLCLPYAETGEWTLTDEDTGEAITYSAEQLCGEGVTFTLKEKRTARLIWVKKK